MNDGRGDRDRDAGAADNHARRDPVDPFPTPPRSPSPGQLPPEQLSPEQLSPDPPPPEPRGLLPVPAHTRGGVQWPPAARIPPPREPVPGDGNGAAGDRARAVARSLPPWESQPEAVPWNDVPADSGVLNGSSRSGSARSGGATGGPPPGGPPGGPSPGGLPPASSPPGNPPPDSPAAILTSLAGLAPRGKQPAAPANGRVRETVPPEGWLEPARSPNGQTAPGEVHAAPRGDHDRHRHAAPDIRGIRRHPRGSRRRGRHRTHRSRLTEVPVLVVAAVIVALLIKTFVVQAFYIPSQSMEPTISEHDKVLVNKAVYHFRDIQPGDIVVFNVTGLWLHAPPAPSALGSLWDKVVGLFGTTPGTTYYIKRVIGVPGDTVACCTPSGQITVNGVPLRESSYIMPGHPAGSSPAPNEGQLQTFSRKVPQGDLWVMGDNRPVSEDSRLHMTGFPDGGFVPESRVVGRAFMIIYPLSRFRFLPIPATFAQRGITAAAPWGVPLGAGFAVAFPLVWLRRRARGRPRACQTRG